MCVSLAWKKVTVNFSHSAPFYFFWVPQRTIFLRKIPIFFLWLQAGSINRSMWHKTEEQMKMKIYGMLIGNNLYCNSYIYLHYISRVFAYILPPFYRKNWKFWPKIRFKPAIIAKMQWKLKINTLANEEVEQDLLIQESLIWDCLFPFYLHS